MVTCDLIKLRVRKYTVIASCSLKMQTFFVLCNEKEEIMACVAP